MKSLLRNSIIIDSSHGWHNTRPGVYDPGAVNHELGLTEAELTLALGISLEIELRDRFGLPTYRIWDQPYSNRMRLANKANGICFISLEFNAAGGTGTEAWHYPSSQEGKRLSALLVREIVLATGFRNRGVKGSTLPELTKTKMPASTLEICFVDNENDMHVYSKKQPFVVRAIATGVILWLAGARP